MTQPRAVIDVVGPQRGADQLLKEIRFLVGALRRAEARQRPGAVGLLDCPQPGSDQVEGLIPRRLAKGRKNLCIVDDTVSLLSSISGERVFLSFSPLPWGERGRG